MEESDPTPPYMDMVTNKTCGIVPDNALHLFRSIVPGESDLPWTGVVFGMTISSIWYWCSDQVRKPLHKHCFIYLRSLIGHY